jgi:hypothetical protein
LSVCIVLFSLSLLLAIFCCRPSFACHEHCVFFDFFFGVDENAFEQTTEMRVAEGLHPRPTLLQALQSSVACCRFSFGELVGQ